MEDKYLKDLVGIIPQRGMLDGEILAAQTISEKIINKEILIQGFFMLIVKNGEIGVSINNENTSIISKNNILFLFRDSTIKVSSYSPNVDARMMIVSKEFIADISMPRKLFSVGFFNKLYESPINKATDSEIEQLICRIDGLIETLDSQNHIYYREMSLCALSLLLFDASNMMCAPKCTENAGNRADNIIENFMALLDEYGREKRDIPFYAAKLNITPQYLSRLVMKQTNKTVYYFICRALMSQARLMLRDRSGTILQISAKLGFSDQASFGKFFKKNSGVAPLEYRKRW